MNSVGKGVQAFRAIGQLVQDFARKVKDQPFFKRVADVAARALEIADIVADLVAKVQTYLDVAQKILDVDALADALKAEVAKLLDSAVTDVNAIVDVVVSKLTGVIDKAAATLFGLIDRLETFVLDALTNVVAHVKDELAPFASVVFRVISIANQLVDVVNNGVDFTAIAGWIKDEVAGVLDKVIDPSILQPVFVAFDSTIGAVIQVRCLLRHVPSP